MCQFNNLLRGSSVIVFSLIFQGSLLFGQEGKYILRWEGNAEKISQTNNFVSKEHYLKFTGAKYFDEGNLPYYSENFKVNDENIYFTIDNLIFETIPDSLLTDIVFPAELPKIHPLVQLLKGGNQKYLTVDIFTLKRNDTTGAVERLVRFEIKKTRNEVNKSHTNLSEKAISSSLLASGSWYKIKVLSHGIYKLTYNDIVGIGLSNPSNIRIFGNGGKQLSYFNGDTRPDGLQECRIHMVTGTDGVFNEGDYILFYAEGPITWDYKADEDFISPNLHGYSSSIYYFLTTDHGAATPIPTVDFSLLTPSYTSNSYDIYASYMHNKSSLIRSGREWYSTEITESKFDTIFNLKGLILSEKVRVKCKTVGRAEVSRKINLWINDGKVASQDLEPIRYSPSYNKFGNEVYFDYKLNSSGSDIKVGLSFDKGQYGEQAFLGSIFLNGRANLAMDNSLLFFRDKRSISTGGISKYTINNINSDVLVWDVTNINTIQAIKGTRNEGVFSFNDKSDALHEYVVFDPQSSFPSPIISGNFGDVGPIQNQDLRGIGSYNYIIVAPAEFSQYADSLAAYHRENSNLSVLVVTPQEIYNDFSSGTPDASSLRDFFRHQYLKATENTKFQYVLLFGDGSYCNHINATGNTNYIPTFQSKNSLDPLYSYVSDDFFGLLDDDEGDINGSLYGKLDIGIGRLPIKMVDEEPIEAEQVVNKLLGYYRANFGDWQNNLTFLGDDGFDSPNVYNNTEFMDQADGFTIQIESNTPGFNFKKIYLDAYPQINESTGPSYPGAKEELIRSLHAGTLLVNYTGHGGETGITSEKIFQTQDIIALKNRHFLPLFITATCSFSRYDEVNMNATTGEFTPETSAGEHLFLNPDGGGIALLSTSRVVNGGDNLKLNTSVYNHLFYKGEDGKRQRLGDVIMLAKNEIGENRNKFNFVLLGDPAMILRYPEYLVCTDSINQTPVVDGADTLKAFGKVTITGYVAKEDSSILTDFNGLVYPKIFDKAYTVKTLGNDGIEPFSYTDQKNLLYKGIASVNEGRFRFSFVVPKDIAYSIGKGKITYYAENKSIDARGTFNDFYIGGTSGISNSDNSGPDIRLFMNNEQFEEGGITNKDPYIYAMLKDENGINTTGNGIGHDLVSFLDYDNNNQYILNEYYQSTIDDYSSGTVLYPLNNLDEGNHIISMKAWDVFNNSSETTIPFVVVTSDGLLLNTVINFPNPATVETTFQYTHNFPDHLHTVVLEVFDLSGRKITTKQWVNFETGFVSTELEWNLQSANGGLLPVGVYPYRLRVTTDNGNTSVINEKLIIIH